MLINIEEIRNIEVLSKTEDFEKRGGELLFRLFRISENYEGVKPIDKYECHLVVARQTIERINYEMNYHWNRVSTKGNRYSMPVYKIDFDTLDKSGVEVSLEEFLGPYYDLELKRPFIKGRKSNETINSFFYYDEAEIVENKKMINDRIRDFEKRFPQNNGNFVYAFMNPPYSISTGNTIRERGEYLIEFMNYFFSDFHNIEIMKWSTDCSQFFDAGKEWWGTFFWTIYNPKKDWYIGVCGSSTD